MKPVFVPKTPHDKALQRALMQWRKPQNRKLVLEALHRTGREDLIGYGKHCLVKPERGTSAGGGHRAAPKPKPTAPKQKSSAAKDKSRPPKATRKQGWAKPRKKH